METYPSLLSIIHVWQEDDDVIIETRLASKSDEIVNQEFYEQIFV